MSRALGAKLTILIALILCGWGPVLSAGLPLWLQGEQLDYEVGYGFMTAGEASLITKVGADSSQLEFLTLATNNGFFESIYPVRDTILTKVSRPGLIPSYFRRVVNEGSYHARSQIRFDYPLKKAYLADSVFESNGKLRRSFDSSVVLDADYHCIISAFYKVRAMYLEPGKTGYFLALSGKKKYKLKVICHRKEVITVQAGTFPCLVVEPVLEGDGIFQSKGSLTIWLSDDARRLPVLMKSKISVGSIRAELKSWNQGVSIPIRK